jgi:hypothetical protein
MGRFVIFICFVAKPLWKALPLLRLLRSSLMTAVWLGRSTAVWLGRSIALRLPCQ